MIKKILFSENKEQYESLLQKIIQGENQLLVWQYDDNSKKRSVFNSFIAEFDSTSNSVSVQTKNDNSYEIKPGEIFLYNETTQAIFKAEQISAQNNFLSLHYPKELMILEEMENDKLKSIFNAVDSNFISKKPIFHKIEITNNGKKTAISPISHLDGKISKKRLF